MHAINKSDDYHNNTISDKPDAYAALADAEPTSETSDAETRDVADGVEDVADGRTSSKEDVEDALHGDAEAVTPAMPEAEEPDDGEAACPVCGDGLGVTEEEVEKFIETHGEAYCEACGARLKKEEA